MFESTTLAGIRALREHVRGVRFVWALITPVTLLTLSLVTYSLASRWLEPAEFGRFAVAIAVLATLVPFVSLGAPVILIRHLAGAGDHRPDPAARPAAYLTILVESGFVIVLAILLDLLPGHPLARWLYPGLTSVVAVGAAATALVDLRVSEDQAAFRFQRQFVGLSAAALVRLGGLALAVAATPVPDHRAAVAGYVGASVLTALYMARREVRSAVRQAAEALAFVRHDLVRIGLPITASGMLAVLTTQIDTLIAAGVLGATDLAQYAAASRLSLVHVTAIGGLTAIALPVSAALATRGALDGYARLSTRLLLPLGALAVAVSIVLAPTAVRVLFGEAYQPSVNIFAILSVGFLLNYAGNPLSQVLYMTHRGHIMVAVQFGQLVVFGAVAGYAASRWGAAGLAAARTVTNLAAVALIGVVSLAVARRVPNDVQTAPSE